MAGDQIVKIRKNKKRINPRYFLNEQREPEKICDKDLKGVIKEFREPKGQHYGVWHEYNKHSRDLTVDEIKKIYKEIKGCVFKDIDE